MGWVVGRGSLSADTAQFPEVGKCCIMHRLAMGVDVKA